MSGVEWSAVDPFSLPVWEIRRELEEKKKILWRSWAEADAKRDAVRELEYCRVRRVILT